VAFDAAPAEAAVRYTVMLGDKVAGLRLVENVLEFVDDAGAPRLRMASPYLVDEQAKRHWATVTVRVRRRSARAVGQASHFGWRYPLFGQRELA